MTKVKICGITNTEDISICVNEGADALGFVIEYPVPVPWNLKVEEAKRLMEAVPIFISKVAVVGDEFEKIMEIAEDLKPDAIQLHGNEPLDLTEKIISKMRSLKIKVIKAVRFSAETGEVISEIKDPIELCKTLEKMKVDAILLDSKTKDLPAGTGKTLDWKKAALIKDSVSVPIILAGGLRRENIRDAILTVRPYAVDVISGVEREKGKKDPVKVRDFIREVHNAKI